MNRLTRQWQYSVFECLLRHSVAAVIKPRLDHVRYYHLCGACQARIESTQAGPAVVAEQIAVIV